MECKDIQYILNFRQKYIRIYPEWNVKKYFNCNIYELLELEYIQNGM